MKKPIDKVRVGSYLGKQTILKSKQTGNTIIECFGDTLEDAENTAEQVAHLLNTHKMLLDSLKECVPYVERALKQNLDSLRDSDPESQFYGEDICSGPIIGRAKKALEAAEQVEVPECKGKGS